jgi:hypothetical protein
MLDENHNVRARFLTPEDVCFSSVQRWINREIEAPNTARVRLGRRRAWPETGDWHTPPDIPRSAVNIPKRSRANSYLANAHMRVQSANRQSSWKFSSWSGHAKDYENIGR